MEALTYRLDNVTLAEHVAGGRTAPFSSEMRRLATLLPRLQSSMLRAQNAAASIHRLPIEILAHIFGIAGMKGWQSLGLQPSRITTQLSMVCHHWRQVALGFPNLWSTIYLHDGAIYDFQFATLCLERSKHAPLSIIISTLFRGAQIANFFAPYSSRIHEISILVPFKYSSSNVPLYLLSTCAFQAPKLQTLRLCTAMWGSMECPTLPTLFGGDIPNVTHLQVESFSSWPGHSFTGLTHLALGSQSQYDVRPPMDAFLDFLEANPRLEELLLDDAGPVDGLQIDRKVALPHLRLAYFITTLPERGMPACVLPHLILSADCSIRTYRDMNPSRLDELLPSPFPLGVAPAGGALSVDRMWLREDSYEFGETALRYSAVSRSAGISTSYRLRGSDPRSSWPEGALLIFLKAVPRPQIRQLRISMAVTLNSFAEKEWRNVFDRLPGLQELTVQEHHLPSILRALMHREPTQHRGLPCPLLSTLYLLRTRDLDCDQLMRFGEDRLAPWRVFKRLVISPSAEISVCDVQRLCSVFPRVDILKRHEEPIFEEPVEMTRPPFGKDTSIVC
ncbi:hypothetical protein FA95DRAFT_35836 [Auriscalpium vulgare]|uniref:Uncharacterized protein n=1 Tax=Auriscalpium vulgare TaxID=40419 RepID=A0ACB8SDS9_9AGAM|nr:hypothetical protein FA95DRAFT_35836 [Auriscalpium vulgare]